MAQVPLPAATLTRSPGVLHHAMLAVDIIEFGRKDPAFHDYVRDALYRVVNHALAEIGVLMDDCHHEDRGDGLILIAPACVSVEPMLGALPQHLNAGIRHHNQMSSEAAQLRVRLAVHAGYVRFDEQGIGGRAVIHMCRLLDAEAFKTALDRHQTDFGLITSDFLHQEIITDGHGLIDPGTFTPITAVAKETRGVAWIWLPQLRDQFAEEFRAGVEELVDHERSPHEQLPADGESDW